MRQRSSYSDLIFGLLLGLILQSANGFHIHSTIVRRTLLSSSEWIHSKPTFSPSIRPRLKTSLNAKAVKISYDPWYPLVLNSEDEEDDADKREAIERDAVQLCANLIQRKLSGSTTISDPDKISARYPLIQNRFMDLTCDAEGERVLESLFDDDIVDGVDDDNILRASVMVLQSLCVFATQVGVKGTPEQLVRMVAHLDSRRDPSLVERDVYQWDADSVRRLKHRLDRDPGVQLLAELQWKRTTQGAFDLLQALGAWTLHEDLALLRSGFPLRFSEAERKAAQEAVHSKHDPDQILGLRQDLRHLKVYTIDSASTSEIDDGLSIEKLENADGSFRHRIWIHIADADRWAPRTSEIFKTAQQRITSLYLPRGPIPMFPPEISNDAMSLKANQDNCALSLAVEINEDGSVDPQSITVTPSLIRVTYRLTYDDVDEMLEEGTGYREEWELGVLLDMARKRRNFRVSNGSAEGLIPNPIPYNSVSIYDDKTESDGIGIRVKVEVSHNAGQNQTVETALDRSDVSEDIEMVPVSSSFLLVTESMILAGEAIAKWKIRLDKEEFGEILNGEETPLPNQLRLPFRTQPKPDFKSRARERRIMEDLRESNIGGGLCYAWYARRFLLPVKVSEHAFPHSGLGLDCYVQWTSPIRRFSDLQTHTSVKRVLRRKRAAELLRNGETIPSSLLPVDFGWSFEDWPDKLEGLAELSEDDLDQDINYFQGIGLIGAARTLQRQSQQYWLFEYIDRANKRGSNIAYTAVVLGCVDPERQQYAIYVYELGLEHRYTSPCRLDPGDRLRLSIESVYPRFGLLSFVRSL